jgi:predicted nucleotidyltransferase
MMRKPNEVADGAAKALAGALGERLRAALLYGSTARGEHVAGTSDVNVLFLLDDIDADTLRRASPILRPFAKDGLAPLLLEWDEWARARDVFGIELLDMRDAHAMLLGDDPLDGADVSRAALRQQAEHELRSRLILLHDGMLRSAEDPGRLGALLSAALPAFVTYLRAALRLAERPVPPVTRAVIEDGARLVGADPAGLLRALEGRSARNWSIPITDPDVDRYNAAAERTALFVDTIGRQES